jgi:hypothetical protein
MTKQAEQAALEAHKLRLIREGELYRISVVHAKMMVSNALQPEAVLHSAVEHAVGMAQARFGALLQPGGLKGINFKAMMPYALTVGSFVARKRLVKPVLAFGVAVALGVGWLVRHRRQD